MRMSLKLWDLWWEKMKNGSSYHKSNFLDCHQFIARLALQWNTGYNDIINA